MTNNFIPHNRPTLGEEEVKMALQVIQSGWVAQGNAVENFENELCSYLGLPFGSAVAVSSGTAALYLSLVALRAEGKNISFPAYCCSSLRHATTLAKGNAFLVDSKIDSPNMNIDAIPPTTQIAIIPHMYGIPQKIPINNSKIHVIEDCAQSLGALVNDVPTGVQGHVSIFSFYATKLITSGGQGGMIVSKDSSIIEEIKDYRIFDQKRDEKSRFNFQLTDLQAAIGSAQLHKLPHFMSRREEIYQQYKEANFPLLLESDGVKPVHFRAILQTQQQKEIISALAKHNISATIPIKEWEIFGSSEQFPNATSWTRNTISLPIYPSLSDGEVKKIIQIVEGVL